MRLRAFLQWRIGVKLHPLSMLLDFGLQIRSWSRLEVGQERESGHFSTDAVSAVKAIL